MTTSTPSAAPARGDIENTLHRYTFGYDGGDLAAIESTFTHDAVLSLRIADGDLIGPFEGRDAILNMMRESAHSQHDQRRHVTTNMVIEQKDDTATAWSYLTLFSSRDGTLTPLSTGKYEDELVRTEDGWKFSRRHIALDLPY